MKNFIKSNCDIILFLTIWIICISFVISCNVSSRNTNNTPKDLEVYTTYTYNGYIYYQFKGFSCIYYGGVISNENNINLKELKVINTYSYNGHLYYQFDGFTGIYHAPDCPICNGKSDNNYAGLKAYYDGYTNQIIELLKSKDNAIEASEKVIEAQREYMKMNGLLEK